MSKRMLRRLGRYAIWGAAGALAIAAAVLLVAWSGVYNIAASRGHWPIVERFLAFGMTNSVELRALAVKSPGNLDSLDRITLGAGHFHGGCMFCHGAPGIPVNPVTRQMLPPPPDLTTAMRPWSDEELFWIVKHGIKYTGMPSWVALERDDETWTVVAFLKKINRMEPSTYRQLALGPVSLAPQTGMEMVTEDSNPQSGGACARCHGAKGTAPASSLVPVLHGQPVAFLSAALKAYAVGARRSGIMEPLASGLQAADIERLAQYYSGLERPSVQPASPIDQTKDDALVEHGRRLAINGDTAKGVPACIVCHGPDASSQYPRLAGQNAPYMAGQLELWKQGYNQASGGGAIMGPIAKRLSSQDMDAVTAYFASRRPEKDGSVGRQ